MKVIKTDLINLSGDHQKWLSYMEIAYDSISEVETEIETEFTEPKILNRFIETYSNKLFIRAFLPIKTMALFIRRSLSVCFDNIFNYIFAFRG